MPLLRPAAEEPYQTLSRFLANNPDSHQDLEALSAILAGIVWQTVSSSVWQTIRDDRSLHRLERVADQT